MFNKILKIIKSCLRNIRKCQPFSGNGANMSAMNPGENEYEYDLFPWVVL